MEPTTNDLRFYLNIDGQGGWSTHVGRGRTPLLLGMHPLDNQYLISLFIV